MLLGVGLLSPSAFLVHYIVHFQILPEQILAQTCMEGFEELRPFKGNVENVAFVTC